MLMTLSVYVYCEPNTFGVILMCAHQTENHSHDSHSYLIMVGVLSSPSMNTHIMEVVCEAALEMVSEE